MSKTKEDPKAILIIKPKYGDVYIDATDEEAAFLEAFKVFDENKYYFDIDKESIKKDSKKLKEAIDFFSNILAAKDASISLNALCSENCHIANFLRGNDFSNINFIQGRIEDFIKKLKREELAQNEEHTLYAQAKKGDGKSAKILLGMRSGHEYEGVEIEWLVVPKKRKTKNV